MMEKQDKIYVAGHSGLVGSALVRALKAHGFENIVTKTHGELDLTNQAQVNNFFVSNKPHYVFLAAAKVGGIWANQHLPADFIQQNLQIQNNVLVAAKEHQAKRLLFLGSSCIYPRQCLQPIKEEYLLTGPLESTNRPYALAKIAGIEMCWAFNRQHSTQYLAVMPTNLYGEGDNYDLKSSHVIPALIRKMHEAKVAKQSFVTVWGTGQVRREFMYSDDLAQACLFLMNLPNHEFSRLVHTEEQAPIINVGCGEDQTIRELAEKIKQVVGFQGELVFDTNFPDGTPRKMLCVDKLHSLGWKASIPLTQGLKRAYQHFQLSYAQSTCATA